MRSSVSASGGDVPGAAARPAGRGRPGGRSVQPWAGGRSGAHVLLLALVAVLVVIGLVMVLSSSSVHALRAYGSSWVFFKRQLAWVAVGTVALVVGARVDYRVWGRLSGPLLGLCLLLLVLVLVPGLGVTVNGSSRWLGSGSVRMQPSELAKLALVVYAATVLAARVGPDYEPGRTTRPVLVVLAGLLGLVMLQPDMGTALIVATIALGLLFVAGTPLRSLAVILACAATLSLVVGMAAPYRRARLLSFVDPWADPANTGYQSIQALVGLGSGGVAGVGLGASRAKWGFLPNAHTDFIFAIIGEEAGLIGGLVVVGLFGAFAAAGIRAARRAPDRLGTFLAAGITTWVVGQALLNMGTVIGLLPVTGVPLPFVSFGGSSLVVVMFAVGVLVNVAGHGDVGQARRPRARPPRPAVGPPRPPGAGPPRPPGAGHARFPDAGPARFVRSPIGATSDPAPRRSRRGRPADYRPPRAAIRQSSVSAPFLSRRPPADPSHPSTA